jgi:hypothetical protein
MRTIAGRAMAGTRALRAAACCAVIVLLAACTADSAAQAPSPSTTRQRPAATATPDPNRERDHPDPHFDFGFTVRITDQGFHPQWLVSLCCDAVTWINDTDAPVRVVFDHQLVHSGEIPPGGSFTWKPKNVQSITYHDGSDPSVRGTLQVNQAFDS